MLHDMLSNTNITANSKMKVTTPYKDKDHSHPPSSISLSKAHAAPNESYVPIIEYC